MMYASVCSEIFVATTKKESLSFMEKKQAATTATTASNTLGMCQKLFNAFQLTLRPLRRLTFRQQQEATAAPAPHSDHPSHPIPQYSELQEPTPPPQEKAQLPLKVQQNHKPRAEEKPLPLPAPPKAELGLLGAAPQPLPPPPQPKAQVQKPKKGINEKVDEYITRTKGKIRTGSGVGKVPSSK